ATLLGTSDADIAAYVAHRASAALPVRASTQARMLSSLKRFFRFALARNLVTADPTLLVDAPKRVPRFPHTVSESDVEALLAAPEVSSAVGLRDRAMLEVLYATGLRVSELVGLKRSGIDLQSGVVRILGKGS